MNLSISNVTKSYGDLTALHPFSLESEGEICGLIGNNGAGKSTLMKMIVGLIVPKKGKILLGEMDVKKMPEAVKHHIGYLPESPLLYPRLTPEELLLYVAEIKGIEKATEEIEYWLEIFGLSAKRNALLNDLSFGMKKKIAISAALIGSPSLLILDEPFNGLDVATMESLSEIIRKRHAAGATILLSSHLMSYIDRLCERVFILEQGKLVAEGSPGDLKKQANQVSFHDTFLHFTK
ncbi:MAG: ABC transporter ATP-binding protein [Nitrospirae bacterium]|nr:ABC transporter ATP-binding protein [Candidatus Manganitrophaceae bacterium]